MTGQAAKDEQQSNRMNSETNSKPKKSKLEKIYELAASLKIAKEENRKLRNELLELRNGQGSSSLSYFGSGGYLSNVTSDGKSLSLTSACSSSTASTKQSSSSSNTAYDVEQHQKMNLALQALKRVTCNQERSLNSMRRKAKLRRDELKLKDFTIASLRRQLKDMQTALEDADEPELRSKLSKTLQLLSSKRRECLNLKEELERFRKNESDGTGNVEDEVDEQVVKVANCTSRSRSPVRKATESQLRINRSSQRARITKSASSQLDQHFQGGQHDDDENDDADDQDEVKTLRGELEQSTNRIVELSMQLEQLKFKDEKASRGNLHQNDVILSPIRRDDNGVDDDIAFDDFECFSPVKFHPPRKTSRAVRDGVIGWGDQDNLFPKDFGL